MQKRAKKEIGRKLHEEPVNLIVSGRVHLLSRDPDESVPLPKQRKVSEVAWQTLYFIKRAAAIIILVSLICGLQRGAAGEEGYSDSLSMRVGWVVSIKRCPTE